MFDEHVDIHVFVSLKAKPEHDGLAHSSSCRCCASLSCVCFESASDLARLSALCLTWGSASWGSCKLLRDLSRWRARRRTQNYRPPASTASATTPPITPPAMAPVFVEQDFALLLDDPVLVGVGDEALVLAVAELNRFATSLLNGMFRPT